MKLNTLLEKLKNKRNRVGRGPGSGLGKTSGRGQKGAGARSGHKRRLTYEGGGVRFFLKLPTRGFSNARFRKKLDSINLKQIDDAFSDGETVTIETLKQRGFFSGPTYGVKLLAHGELSKKVTIELSAFSKAAVVKLEAAKIQFKTVK